MEKDKHISVGKTGEEIAAKFLEKKGFRIIETNVNRKWGELDIVAENKKTKRVHVVEVKTVSGSVASAHMHPAENLTKHKLQKLERTAILYTKQKGIIDWQFDVVLVWYQKSTPSVQVKHIERIY